MKQIIQPISGGPAEMFGVPVRAEALARRSEMPADFVLATMREPFGYLRLTNMAEQHASGSGWEWG